MNEVVYCENPECRVVMFNTENQDATKQSGNCPGCGQFGRKKGKE